MNVTSHNFRPKSAVCGASVAQSSVQAPFTSKAVGSTVAVLLCKKGQSALYPESWVSVFSRGELTGRMRINIVRKIIS